MPLPLAKIRKIVYRRDDGTIEVDGNPGLGAFGQTLGASLLRTRVAPRLPHAFGLAAQRPGERAEAEAAAARAFSATIAALSLPALGKIELRMDPEDTLAGTLGPALLTARSERGVLLSAPELELALHVRSVRYDLPSKALLIDASPNPGPYVTALAAMCVEALLLPLLRKGFKLAPDAAAGERWSLFEAMGVRLYLPPGATLTAKRTPDGVDFSASEPVMLDGGGGPVADVALKRVRWVAADDRVVVESEPPAGPLLTWVARRAIDRVVPDALVKTLAKRMALPVPDGESHALPAAPTSPALLQTELAHVGPLAVHVDVREGVELRLEHDRATLRSEEHELQSRQRAPIISYAGPDPRRPPPARWAVPRARQRDLFRARAADQPGREVDRPDPRLLGPKYSSDALRKALTEIFDGRRLADAKHNLVVPAVNVSLSQTKVFKTPHGEMSTGDQHVLAVDVAMATSAAPAYFPSVRVGKHLYADGRIFAVAPDQVALHETEHFLGVPLKRVRMLSIGTATAGYRPADGVDANDGAVGWLSDGRLILTTVSVQQQHVESMLEDRLGARYQRLDTEWPAAAGLGIDVATPEAAETLLRMVERTLARLSSAAWKQALG